MMRQIQNNEKKSGRNKPKILPEPDLEKEILTDSWMRRKLILELERTAFNPSKDIGERLDALSKLKMNKQELEKKIDDARIELRKKERELLEKRDYLMKMLVGKYGELIGRREYQKDIEGNDPNRERRTYIDELEKCRNACEFAIERLSLSSDEEIRNRAFDLVQNNLIAVKITCSNSEHSDIRERAREILRAAKGKNNRYFYNYSQKPGKDTVFTPDR